MAPTITINMEQGASDEIPLRILSRNAALGQDNGDQSTNQPPQPVPESLLSLAPDPSQISEQLRSAQRASTSAPTGPQPSAETSAVEKWQLRLNFTQVVIAFLALLVVFALLRPQLADHKLNEISLKLSEWAAWKDFRDECRTMMSEARVVGKDCEEALHQTLSKPPIPIEAIPTDQALNKSRSIKRGTQHERGSPPEVTTTATYRSRSILLALAKSTLLILSVFSLRWLMRYWVGRSLSQHVEILGEPSATWVSDHIPRLSPIQPNSLTTGYVLYDTQIPQKRAKSHELVGFEDDAAEAGSLESDHDDSPWLVCSDELESISSGLEIEHRDTEGWLPTANIPETYSSPYSENIKLILSNLQTLGFHEAIFSRVPVAETPWSHIEKSAFVGDWLIFDLAKWLDDASTLRLSAALPDTFLNEVKNANFSKAWTVKLPHISFSGSLIGQVEVSNLNNKWLFWYCVDSETHPAQPEPRLDGPTLYLMDMGDGKVLLLFDSLDSLEYSRIIRCVEHRSPIIERFERALHNLRGTPYYEVLTLKLAVLESLFAEFERGTGSLRSTIPVDARSKHAMVKGDFYADVQDSARISLRDFRRFRFYEIGDNTFFTRDRTVLRQPSRQAPVKDNVALPSQEPLPPLFLQEDKVVLSATFIPTGGSFGLGVGIPSLEDYPPSYPSLHNSLYDTVIIKPEAIIEPKVNRKKDYSRTLSPQPKSDLVITTVSRVHGLESAASRASKGIRRRLGFPKT